MEPKHQKYDFGGYATRANVKCTDGRIIRKNAFKDNDGQTVPLVWQHRHDDPVNILGHALLENREDGVYAYCSFNDDPKHDKAQTARSLVKHGDIKSLSIYANKLMEKGSEVVHGVIREVSLVLAGANQGAYIENVYMQHSDGSYSDEPDRTEAELFMGEDIEFPEESEESSIEHAEKTAADVLNSMNDEQKNLLYAMVGAVNGPDDNMEHSDNDGEEEVKVMKVNVFDKSLQHSEDQKTGELTHEAQLQLIKEADNNKVNSLKHFLVSKGMEATFDQATLKHEGEYGIDNISYLFPDAQLVRRTPDLITRDTGWVGPLLAATSKTPFSRIKSSYATLTADEARAKGYITGKQKLEEVFPVAGRETTPQTIYKKQRLDRDHIIDITSFDVVAWMKAEMQFMLREEIARAILIGDGRDIAAEDKINPQNIRPILTDDDFYTIKYNVPATVNAFDIVDEIIRSQIDYKGTGRPVMYTSPGFLIDMLLLRDNIGRRLYNNMTELAATLRVRDIVEVEVMGTLMTDGAGPCAILVNPADYTVGMDRMGQTAMFDDFDLDFNQYRYLIETRMSGALTRFHSAIVINKEASGG